jgi:hypothetical protein
MVKSFTDYLVENTNEITFAFGRFNPPTTGHAKRNPLDFKTKVKYLRKMFPKYARNIMADKGMRTAFDVISALYDQGFTQTTMVVGADRVIEFDKLLNKYNGKKGKHGFYQFENGVKVVSAGARDPDSDDVTGMSASKLRAAAAENDLKTFSKGMPKGFKDVEGLFNAVRSGMGLKESHNHRQHVQLEKVSDLREDYVQGNLFKVDDEVVLKETDEVGTIKVCGSNYVLVEFGTIKKRCWLDSVEKLTEEDDKVKEEEDNEDPLAEIIKAPGTGVETSEAEIMESNKKEFKDFKQFMLKDDFKLTPALKAELEKIAMKLDMKDFSSKSHKIATAMNILKKKHGYSA